MRTVPLSPSFTFSSSLSPLRVAALGSLLALPCVLLPSTGALGAAEVADAMPPHRVVALEPLEVLARLRDSSERTLAVKRFDFGWIESLDRRGQPIVHTRESSESFEYIGMPIGGICAGQLYLGGDGKLWCWDIFNTKGMRDTRSIHTHRQPYARSDASIRAHHRIAQGFALRLEGEDGPRARTLDRDGFERIRFRGEYPIGYVRYGDEEVPAEVSLEAFSPFVPLDLESSTYPATCMEFTVHNPGTSTLRGELIGWLENAVCIESRSEGDGRLRNRAERGDRLALLTCAASPPPPDPAPRAARPDILFEDFEGGLGRWTREGKAFERSPRPSFHHQPLAGHRGKGLADSFLNDGEPGALATASDEPTGRLVSEPFTIRRRGIRFLIGGGRHPDRTAARLLVDGRSVRSATGANSERLSSHVFRVEDLEGREARIEIVDAHSGGWGHVLVDHIVFTDDLRAEEVRLSDRPDFGSMALGVMGPKDATTATAAFDAPGGALEVVAERNVPFSAPSPVGAVGRRFELEPGESVTVPFVLAWWFPNAPRFPISTEGGRAYGRRFGSAREVVESLVADRDRLTRLTRLWHDTWYDSTLPWWFLDRTFLNTSILATNTCYLFRDGRWYAMPGEGGIIACTWPRGGDEALRLGNRHFAGYLNECQPGYEWAATSLYMWHGMPYHALAHTRTMHDRYAAAKRNPWNEVEWGSHYSRSMASYGVFVAACGYEVHGPKGYYAFSPRITPGDFRAAFTAPRGWGSFSQRRAAGRQVDTLEVRQGDVRIETLGFDLPARAGEARVAVTLAGKPWPTAHSRRANRVTITLDRPATLAAGAALRVEIGY